MTESESVRDSPYRNREPLTTTVIVLSSIYISTTTLHKYILTSSIVVRQQMRQTDDGAPRGCAVCVAAAGRTAAALRPLRITEVAPGLGHKTLSRSLFYGLLTFGDVAGIRRSMAWAATRAFAVAQREPSEPAATGTEDTFSAYRRARG